MKNKWHKKAIVFGIIIILTCSTILPSISSKKIKPENDISLTDETSTFEDEYATLTFNTFNENGKKENKIELPSTKAQYIFDLFENLKNMTISHPNSQETLDLKNRFIELLEEYGLIPGGMSKGDIQPLINPHGTPNNPKTRGRTGFLGLIFEVLFINRFNHLRLLEPLDYPSEWSIVCNVAGGGYGIPLPLFIIPRPRLITVWGAADATTAVGSLLLPKSFVARGNQQGICLGFVGVGLTIAFFGFMGYAMLGYSLYTAIRAQEIERYNNEPTITNENPPTGSTNVPTSLSELSFRISDGDGDLMSYTVTTSPNIGSGSGNYKGNGVYSVPVSELEYDTEYTWYVIVDDGYDIVEKTFSFYTESIPFNPFDEGWHYRKMITVDHTKVDGDLTSFPVSISMTDVDLRDKAQSDGDDILFMDGPGIATKLYHEIEYYENSNGELVSWVNIPSLSAGVDTVLYMYYGNPGCSSQELTERVWNSDYVAVYHMDGSDYTEIDDSTSNDLDVVDYQGNPVYQQTGKVGFCVDFDDDSLNVADDDLLSFTDGSGHDKPMTVEAWVRYDIPGVGIHGPIVSKYAHGQSEWLLYKGGEPNRGRLYFFDQSTEAAVARKTESSLNVDNTGWNYISGSYIGNEEDAGISFVLDGVVEEGEQHGGWAYEGMHNLGQPMRIGAYHSNNINQWFYWQGLIDEVRISKTARSSNWLITSYNTMNDPSSFFSVGPEESAP